MWSIEKDTWLTGNFEGMPGCVSTFGGYFLLWGPEQDARLCVGA